MRPAFLPLLMVLTAGAAQAAPSLQHLFPASREPEASGRPVTVKVGPARADVVRVTPVIFLSNPGTEPSQDSKSMCGLVIQAPGHAPQGVVTIGTGRSGATPSCDAVLAVGALPAARGERTRRIGAIHAVSSRNAQDGRDIIVLHRVGTGPWTVDEDATGRIEFSLRKHTIAEMRTKLH